MANLDELEADLEAVRQAIREITLGRKQSQTISGGGATRSKQMLSLPDLLALKKDLEDEISRLKPRGRVYAVFGSSSVRRGPYQSIL